MKVSAVIFSIAKAAKINNLKSYNYFEFLLSGIPKYMKYMTLDFLKDHFPWYENILV